MKSLEALALGRIEQRRHTVQHRAHEGYLATMEMVGLKTSVDFYGEVDGACDAFRWMHVRQALCCSRHSRM